MVQTRQCLQAARKYLGASLELPAVRPLVRVSSAVDQKRHITHLVKDGRPFRLAVIGSGPAGFYTAYKVMSTIQDAVVDMYESLPVPFGLVRFGVAPDHPEVKNCQDRFAEVASSPRFNFIGNIEVGKSLPLATLKDHYSAILFTYGASKDRKLDIPGEDLCKGIYSAREFVGWYNGLPEHSALHPDLSTSESAVIIGQGNVALDIARTLLTDIDKLRQTDMTEQALATFSRSKVKHVHAVGRRGPMQVSFTIKEVRELMNLPGVSFDAIDPLLLPPDTKQLPRTSRRMLSLLKAGSSSKPESTKKTWSLDFMQSPHKFISQGDPKELAQVEFILNKYQDPEERFDPRAKVAPMENSPIIHIPTKIAFRSIGYFSEALQGMQDLGIQFDKSKGIIPNDHYGRIYGTTASEGIAKGSPSNCHLLPGLYCAGWVKRGPAGVIANTMEDAFATAEAMASDWESGKPFLGGGQGWDALSKASDLLKTRPVSWVDWLKIDAAEKARGKAKGKEREKFTSVNEMLSVLD
ncbi:MAG: hypothetical protein Q9163_001219 [Psora crenata]